LRFELAQMCYYINIEIIRSFSSFLILYTPIYYTINIKFAYKTPHENPHMRPHTAYAVCDDHPHTYWNPHFKSLVISIILHCFIFVSSKWNHFFLIIVSPIKCKNLFLRVYSFGKNNARKNIFHGKKLSYVHYVRNKGLETDFHTLCNFLSWYTLH
jgi:hypothetical protein